MNQKLTKCHYLFQDHDLLDTHELHPNSFSALFDQRYSPSPSSTTNKTSPTEHSTLIDPTTTCSPPQHNHDLHKATFTSYCFGKNETHFNRISKNNLLIARLLSGDCGRNQNPRKLNPPTTAVQHCCFIIPIISVECDRIQFIDSKINQINNKINGECAIVRWPINVVLVARLVSIINSCDHNFVSVHWPSCRQCADPGFDWITVPYLNVALMQSVNTTNDLINSKQTNNYDNYTRNYNDNTKNNICDIFCTKLRQYFVELNIGIVASSDAFVNIQEFHSFRVHKLKCRLKEALHGQSKDISELIHVLACTKRPRRKRRRRNCNDQQHKNRQRDKSIDKLTLKSSSRNSESLYTIPSSSLSSIPSPSRRPITSQQRSTCNSKVSRKHYQTFCEGNVSQLLRVYSRLLLLVLLACFPVISASMHNVKYSTQTVQTKYGPLRGIIVRTNPTVEAFLGVPYATPPVGSLR